MRGIKAKELRKLAYTEVAMKFSEVRRPVCVFRQAHAPDMRYLYQELKGRRAFSKRKH